VKKAFEFYFTVGNKIPNKKYKDASL